MEITILDENGIIDFIDLIDIFKDVFENTFDIPDQNYLQQLLRNPHFLVFVVKNNGKVLGGATIYVLDQYYSEKQLAYIYDIGISTDFQGRGIGKSLIVAICDYCSKNGFEEAFVQAEYEDVDAVNFYKRTGFSTSVKAIQFGYRVG